MDASAAGTAVANVIIPVLFAAFTRLDVLSFGVFWGLEIDISRNAGIILDCSWIKVNAGELVGGRFGCSSFVLPAAF